MRGTPLAIVTLLTLLTGAFQAHASNKVRCEVITIHASNSDQGIDKKLEEYTPIFKHPPFSTYNTFKLIHRQAYDMPLNVPVSLSLPKTLGGSLRLNGKLNSKLDLTLMLARQGQDPITVKGKASPGAPFFAAGLRNPKGIWIFGVVCNHNKVVAH